MSAKIEAPTAAPASAEMPRYPAHEQMKALTAVAGKYLPYHGARPELTIVRAPTWRLKDHPDAAPEDIPVPQDAGLRHHASEALYLDTGRQCFVRMGEVLRIAEWSLEPDGRVLDFGCAAGRMTRQFLDHARGGAEVWGADLDSACIYWAQRHLSPPFRFLISTTVPHLPFEDRYFDLITAWSVFTHIDDMTTAWLLELRRILSDRGAIYITVNDDASIEVLRAKENWRNLPDFKLYDDAVLKRGIKPDDYMSVSFAIAPYSRIYHNRRYLTEQLGLYFKVRAVANGGYGYQSAYVLSRR